MRIPYSTHSSTIAQTVFDIDTSRSLDRNTAEIMLVLLIPENTAPTIHNEGPIHTEAIRVTYQVVAKLCVDPVSKIAAWISEDGKATMVMPLACDLVIGTRRSAIGTTDGVPRQRRLGFRRLRNGSDWVSEEELPAYTGHQAIDAGVAPSYDEAFSFQGNDQILDLVEVPLVPTTSP